MMRKRKPLDEAAQSFVFGGNVPKEDIETELEVEATPVVIEQPQVKAQEKVTSKTKVEPVEETTPPLVKPDLLSQLQAPAKEPTVRITVDLAESMHRKLSLLSARTGKKKAEIVRFLLDEALKDVED
ncbi:CopG family transcriptional regulator [Brunnivagina elsteri]|uniref:CopG family transcriptional regulator n=1 Tax=Brunnivagina elsteri CCALA 953 TaxID=987040 RepID=A0A2A2TKA9_9CYAN|nr:CopG family transcriptional regulator [Calothrix elsteri]PAX54882.1 CopG family transcriptional regulator [Calothrix elsteri CCALA 953]